MHGTTVAIALASLALIWFLSRQAQAAISPSGNASRTLPPMPATIQASTLAFVRSREGLRLSAYPDGEGYSIGYGHYLGPAPSPASISIAQADDMLMQDVNAAAATLTRIVTAPLTQNQYDALISFIYNIGADAFVSSTLLGKLNNRDYTGAAAEFGRWVYSKGVVVGGLVTRRNVEKNLFLA